MAMPLGFSTFSVAGTSSYSKSPSPFVQPTSLRPFNAKLCTFVTYAIASEPVTETATETKKRAPRGFSKPRLVSPEMKEFLGGRTEIPQTELLKVIWAHIKEKDLQDFTMEQDSVIPANGWKAYYAATRAIVNMNQQFFDIIRERSLPEMGRFWLNVDYVKCFNATGELFTGGVLGSWALALNWEPAVEFQVRDVRTPVLPGVAWVTMKAYTGMEDNYDHTHPMSMTNVFEFHNGQWFMVHHHSLLLLVGKC